MKPGFLDTSGWLAALSPAERGHAWARAAYERATNARSGFVTTTLVLGEMHAMLLRARGAADAGRFLDVVLGSKAIRVVSPPVQLVATAVDRWLHGFRDQRFSLCDAVSFEVMRHERLTEVLALDRHFKTAGYRLLD